MLTNTERQRLEEIESRSLKWQRGEETDSAEQLQHNVFFLLLVIRKFLEEGDRNA